MLILSDITYRQLIGKLEKQDWDTLDKKYLSK